MNPEVYEYKVVGKHIPSGASVERHFNLNSNFAITNIGELIVKDNGIEMPATFQQRRSFSRGYRRH